MILSMTGYGKEGISLPGRDLTIELRTLNSKGLDVNIRIPFWLREKEIDIRAMLSRMGRGKADLFITAETTGQDAAIRINKPLAHHYHKILQELQREFREDNGPLLPMILRIPDVLSPLQEEVVPEEWDQIRNGIDLVMDKTDAFRRAEGAAMEEDLRNRTNGILHLLHQTEPSEHQRKERIRENLLRDFRQMDQANGSGAPDPNRFEQELIYYLEKMDFTEEKIRLTQHCAYFIHTLEEPESQGKKLGFICQEMGREINTLGAKAADATIQHLVVRMKDELEKIKEQLLNSV